MAGARRWPGGEHGGPERGPRLGPGPCAGRCSPRRRCGRVIRAGTPIRSRRRVASRATACAGLARVPAARSRLWVIAAQITQALLAANRPEVISSLLEGVHHVRDEGCMPREARRGCDYLPLSLRQRKVLNAISKRGHAGSGFESWTVLGD